jgi:AcrR family transcriptional regulator
LTDRLQEPVLFKRTFDLILKPIENESLKRILESAEFLFSKNGYHGTSIRDVIKKARVNLAAVNYHFGNKESLYCEILRCRLRSINQGRLEKLESAIELAGDKPIPLALIIDIFARPFFEVGQSAKEKNGHSSLLIGRSIIEPLPFAEELLKTELHLITTRFARAVRRHVIGMQPEEFMWRLNFVIGAMHHTLATLHQMTVLTRGLCQNDDFEGALRHFTQFAVDAFTTSSRDSRR